MGPTPTYKLDSKKKEKVELNNQLNFSPCRNTQLKPAIHKHANACARNKPITIPLTNRIIRIDFLTIAYKFVKPLTRVGILVNLCWNASLRLWAGSVEMMSTDGLTFARRIDMIELHVVLPTPPLPPTKTHFSVSCSIMFCTVPSGNSSLEPINQS